jgi:hypothetical protein
LFFAQGGVGRRGGALTAYQEPRKSIIDHAGYPRVFAGP